MENSILCALHDLPIESLCLKISCENKSVCKACRDDHKSHTDFLFPFDLFKVPNIALERILGCIFGYEALSSPKFRIKFKQYSAKYRAIFTQRDNRNWKFFSHILEYIAFLQKEKANLENRYDAKSLTRAKLTYEFPNSLSSIGKTIKWLRWMNLLLTGSANGVLSVWSSDNYSLIRKRKIHSAAINNIKYSYATNFIFTVSHDHTLAISTFKSQKIQLVKQIQLEDTPAGLLIIDNLNTLVVTGFTYTMKAWNSRTLKEKHNLASYKSNAGYGLIYIKKYNLITFSLDRGIIMFLDANTFEPKIKFEMPTNHWLVWSIKFDEKRDIIVGSFAYKKIIVLKLDFANKSLNYLFAVFLQMGDVYSLIKLKDEDKMLVVDGSHFVYQLDFQKKELTPLLTFTQEVNYLRLVSKRRFIISPYLDSIQAFWF